MARAGGYRPAKKMTQHQLTEMVIGLNHQIELLSHGVAADLRRLNVLFFSNLSPRSQGIEFDPRWADCGLLLDGLPDEAFTNADMMDDSEE